VDVHDTSASAEAIVQTSEIDGANAILSQGRGAHDAGLDGDIEVGIVEDGLRMARHDFGQGDELGVPRSLWWMMGK
jgi:hypothetical protein